MSEHDQRFPMQDPKTLLLYIGHLRLILSRIVQIFDEVEPSSLQELDLTEGTVTVPSVFIRGEIDAARALLRCDSGREIAHLWQELWRAYGAGKSLQRYAQYYETGNPYEPWHQFRLAIDCATEIIDGLSASSPPSFQALIPHWGEDDAGHTDAFHNLPSSRDPRTRGPSCP